MNGQNSSWEAALQETAASFPYPPTPDVVAGVRQRLAAPPPHWSRLVVPSAPRTRRRWAAAILLLLLAGTLLVVPPVRAALVAFFRAGAITIFVGEPTPTLASTQVPSMTPPPLLETAPGVRVTLAEAQAQAGFPLRLPLEYGTPDEVYVQPLPDPGLAGQVVIMVWRDPAQTSLPEQPRLRLYQIGAEEYGLKQAAMQAVREAWVHGQNAFWVEGGHVIQLPAGPYLVEQDVLIWTGGSVTYRLESGLSLAEAVQLAESLREIAPKRLPTPQPSP